MSMKCGEALDFVDRFTTVEVGLVGVFEFCTRAAKIL